jgi:hypothetical protein
MSSAQVKLIVATGMLAAGAGDANAVIARGPLVAPAAVTTPDVTPAAAVPVAATATPTDAVVISTDAVAPAIRPAPRSDFAPPPRGVFVIPP